MFSTNAEIYTKSANLGNVSVHVVSQACSTDTRIYVE